MHRKLNEHVGLLKQEDTTLRLVAAKSSSALKEEATKRLIAEQRELARSEAIATFRAANPVQNASNTKACLICQANEDCSRSELDEEFRLASCHSCLRSVGVGTNASADAIKEVEAWGTTAQSELLGSSLLVSRYQPLSGTMEWLHEAALSGRVSDVRRALDAGEDVDSTNSNNWTALMLAASRGRVEVVQLLLECHANVDLVATKSKSLRSLTFVFLLLLGLETGDLFFIVIIGGILGLLSTLTKPDHGWTALTLAAYYGQLRVTQLLLDHGALIDLRDDNGYTAVMRASERGHLEIVQLLLARNASLGSNSCCSQPSPWKLALRNHHGEIADAIEQAQSDRSRARAQQEADHSGSNSSRSTGSPKTTDPDATTQLSRLVELCNDMAETQAISEDVLERLWRVNHRLNAMKRTVRPEITTAFHELVTHFQAFLSQHVNKPLDERLRTTSTQLGKLHDFHCQIDELEDLCGPRNMLETVKSTWMDAWDTAVLTVDQQMMSPRETRASRDCPDLESGQLLPESATNTEVETSDAPVPAIPEWFIPEEAVQKQPKPFNAGSYGKVFRGAWRGSKVVVKCVEATSVEEKRTFLREAKIWYKLRHPHIVTFFGACHTSRPCFFVCEEAANGNLVDYLAKMKAAGRSLVWQKLHEAALGLLFLHQNGIVHGDLKCNQILVNGDGVAKLTDFGMSFASSDSRPANSDTNVRWAAPECVTSEGLPPTCESDVFSFGMSVVEAVTNNVPWGVHLTDDVVQNHLLHRRFLSRPAAFESDAHWQLVLDLCAFEPRRRLELSTAID
ncbi:hypothetical protein BBJ28_00020117 [Nothophytophthora sp. Chile5]|nr:hypothetical protein BBJ28_00020117 [Nothophytophthora sp. Chile5]